MISWRAIIYKQTIYICPFPTFKSTFKEFFEPNSRLATNLYYFTSITDMSTFVQKAEEAMTSKQPERDSSSNHGSHNSDSDPSNKADTQVISDKGVTAIYLR